MPIFAQRQATIETQNMEATINSSTLLFSDLYYSYHPDDTTRGFNKFFVPKNENTSPIAAATLWITASSLDSSTIYSSSKTYPESYKWQTGPLSTDTSVAFKNTYNRIWKITKTQIDNHKLNFNNPNYIMPEVIKNWPANGNITYGESPTIAPFVDVNNSQYYDPESGDYPLIKGDNAILSVFNDSKIYFGMNLDVIRMVYTYNDSASANRLFVSYLVKNRSKNTYKNVRLTSWNDIDIGNLLDDYNASVPLKNAIAFYNKDSIDEDLIYSDGKVYQKGYQFNPPAFGVKFLNKNMAVAMDHLFRVLPTNRTFEYYPFESYNLSNGFWPNGKPLYYGGIGYYPALPMTDTTKRVYHVFPGHPKNDTAWTEVNVNSELEERVMTMSTPGHLLAPNQTLCLDLVYCFAQQSANQYSLYGEYDLLLAEFDRAQEFYNQKISFCPLNNVSDDSITILASNYMLCQQGNLNFSLNNLPTNVSKVNWTFEGAFPNTFSGFTPTNIFFGNIGAFNVTANIIFDTGDSIVLTKQNLIRVIEPKSSPLVDGVEINFFGKCEDEFGLEIQPINARNYYHALFEYSTPKLGTFASSYNGFVHTNETLHHGDSLTLTITSTDNCIINPNTTNSVVVKNKFDVMVIRHENNLLEVVNPDSNVSYQWYIYRDQTGTNIKLPNETNRTLFAQSNLVYFVEVTYPNGCIKQSKLISITNTNIKEQNQLINFSIAPNPLSGNEINIIFPQYIGEVNITIVNNLGKVITETTSKNRITNIIIENLPAGQYFVQIKSNDRIIAKPLVKL